FGAASVASLPACVNGVLLGPVRPAGAVHRDLGRVDHAHAVAGDPDEVADRLVRGVVGAGPDAADRAGDGQPPHDLFGVGLDDGGQVFEVASVVVEEREFVQDFPVGGRVEVAVVQAVHPRVLV